MAKRNPLPCTPANCGDNFDRCGKKSTYVNHKCRCDSCHAADSAWGKRYREANREKIAKQQKQWREANREVLSEKSKQYYAENRGTYSEKSKQYYCENREQIIERSRQYYEENRETVAERTKLYREANRETILERKRQYHHANREACVERSRRYYAENREAFAEYMKQYVEANRDKVRERQRRHAAENRDSYRERLNQWKIDNPDRYREQGIRAGNRRRARKCSVQTLPFTQEQLEQRFAYYGNKCYLQLESCTSNLSAKVALTCSPTSGPRANHVTHARAQNGRFRLRVSLALSQHALKNRLFPHHIRNLSGPSVD